jgi:hypothetical protein
MNMIADIAHIELYLICQIAKSAPNILWSARGLLSDSSLQVGRSNPAVIVAKISLQSWLGTGMGSAEGRL